VAWYIESHWAWIEQIADHIKATGDIGPELSSRIALCKVQGGRLLELANREAQQVLDGNGYQRGGIGERVEQISRELRMSIVGGERGNYHGSRGSPSTRKQGAQSCKDTGYSNL
jgi:alkylation response protein AidB-like acyl-CoA dehydrogenase